MVKERIGLLFIVFADSIPPGRGVVFAETGQKRAWGRLLPASRPVFTDGAMWRLLVRPESRATLKLSLVASSLPR